MVALNDVLPPQYLFSSRMRYFVPTKALPMVSTVQKDDRHEKLDISERRRRLRPHLVLKILSMASDQLRAKHVVGLPPQQLSQVFHFAAAGGIPVHRMEIDMEVVNDKAMR